MGQARDKQAGLSLIELVAVIVVLSVTGVGVVTAFSQMGRNHVYNEDLQAAAQMAQACAEHILGSRRNLGYAARFTNCSLLPAFNGYGPPTVASFVPPAPTCPAGATCIGNTITANYGTSGASVVVTLMLTSY